MFIYKPLAMQSAELRKSVQATRSQVNRIEANAYYIAMMADIELPEDDEEATNVTEVSEVTDNE